jgi:hypothetical protein
MTGLLLTIISGFSFEISDFTVDGLIHCWERNKNKYRHIKQPVINLKNEPYNSSHRTNFMKGLPGLLTSMIVKSLCLAIRRITANITPSCFGEKFLKNMET